MNVTTINITTVRLSNTESKVNYESDQSANLASSPCYDVVVNLSFVFSALRTVREGFPSHGSPTLSSAGTNYSNWPGKGGKVSLSFYSSSFRHPPCVFRPLPPFPNPQMSPPPATWHCMGIGMACRPARLPWMIGDSLPKRRKGWIKKRGYYEPSAPRIVAARAVHRFHRPNP